MCSRISGLCMGVTVSPALSACHTGLCGRHGHIHSPVRKGRPRPYHEEGGAEPRLEAVSSWDLEPHLGSFCGLGPAAHVPPQRPTCKMGMVTTPASLRVCFKNQRG